VIKQDEDNFNSFNIGNHCNCYQRKLNINSLSMYIINFPQFENMLTSLFEICFTFTAHNLSSEIVRNSESSQNNFINDSEVSC